jgi:hypothetical protein
MLFYIKAETQAKVQGISGPFTNAPAYLVNANSREEARNKFEARVWADHAHMFPATINFDYKELAEEIK